MQKENKMNKQMSWFYMIIILILLITPMKVFAEFPAMLWGYIHNEPEMGATLSTNVNTVYSFFSHYYSLRTIAGKQLITIMADGYETYTANVFAQVCLSDCYSYNDTERLDFILKPKKPQNKVVIVSGYGGVDLLQDIYLDISDYAFNTFKHLGIPAENINYLCSNDENDCTELTLETLTHALSIWSRNSRNLIIYMIGDGASDRFWLNQNETISPTLIDSWLDDIEDTIDGSIFFIYESSYSGNFISFLKSSDSDHRRIIITSCDKNENSNILSDGYMTFSNHFFSALYREASFLYSYKLAKQLMYDYQTAQIEADSNDIYNEKNDLFFLEQAEIFTRGDLVDDYYICPKNCILKVCSPGIFENDKGRIYSGRNSKRNIPSLIENVKHGTLQLSTDGSFTYTPDHFTAINDSFVYCDNNDTSLTATVIIEVIDSHMMTVNAKSNEILMPIHGDRAYYLAENWYPYTIPTTPSLTNEGVYQIHGRQRIYDQEWLTKEPVTLTVDHTPPDQPVLVNSIPVTNVPLNTNTIRIEWKASTDNLYSSINYAYILDDQKDTIPDKSTYTTQLSYTCQTLEPEKIYYFHVSAVDGSDNMSETLHVGPLVIDTQGPVITSLYINNNDTQCTQRHVDLSLDAIDYFSGISLINISNSGFGEGNWQVFSQNIDWVLTDGEGTKTVFVQVKDHAGNISQRSDSIEMICTFQISPADIELIVDQRQKISILNPANCQWTVTTENDWIDFCSSNSGKGDGYIEIKAQTDHIEKNGILTINDQSIQVHYIPILQKVSEINVVNDTQGMKITWTPSPDFNIFYHVYRSELKDGEYYPINSFPANVLTSSTGFTDIDVQPGKNYCYAIKAENVEGYVSNLTESVCLETTEVSDYEVIFDTYPQTVANIKGSTSFNMTIKKKSIMGGLNISCSGLKKYMTYELILDEKKGVASIHNFDQLPAPLELKITLGPETTPQEYVFDISFQNVWETGSSKMRVYPLSILAVPLTKGGLFVALEKEECFYGETVKLYGMIYPPLKYHNVDISIDDASNLQRTIQVTTDDMGFFEDSAFVKTLDKGTYKIYAQFTDENTNTYESARKSFIVNKQKRDLVLFNLNNSHTEIKPDQNYTIYGELAPKLPSEKIILKVFLSTYAYEDVKTYPVYTDSSGQFELTDKFFQHKGFYQIKVYWQGDENNIGCESNLLKISSGSPGLAIILGGGKYDVYNSYSLATSELTSQMYRNLKHIGYDDESIYYMINTDKIDIDDDGMTDNVVDEKIPSLSKVLNLLKSDFVSTLDSENPLFIYIQGHATRGGNIELVSDDGLTPDILFDQLDALQNNTGCTVILLLEFCYSGSYIETLSRENRIILTSIDANNVYSTDSSGKHCFSNYLFNRILKGDSLFKAFNYALIQFNPDPQKNDPVPQMDDNGDKIYDNLDGLFAANIHLGNTYLWAEPKITDISAPVILEANANTASISLLVNEDHQYIKEVIAQIITPQDQKNMNQDNVAFYDQQIFSYNTDNNCFETTLSHLNQPGVYQIVLYAQNTDLEVSEPQFLYIRTAHEYSTIDLNQDMVESIDDVIYGLQQLCKEMSTDIRLADILQCFIQLSVFK